MKPKECSQEICNDFDDTLSLSDLPLIQLESNNENETLSLPPQHEFDFHSSPSQQSEMRAADEIFFHGLIRPTTSDYPRWESVSSHHSSASCGSSSAVPRNLFHSHPSPSPRILMNKRQIIPRNDCVRKSWSWSVFRLGLMAAPPPEIAFRDLKTRCYGKNTGMGGEKRMMVKAWDFAGGCTCSVDVAFTKRNKGSGKGRRRGEEGNLAAADKSTNNRTFEWLKYFPIQGAVVGER